MNIYVPKQKVINKIPKQNSKVGEWANVSHKQGIRKEENKQRRRAPADHSRSSGEGEGSGKGELIIPNKFASLVEDILNYELEPSKGFRDQYDLSEIKTSSLKGPVSEDALGMVVNDIYNLLKCVSSIYCWRSDVSCFNVRKFGACLLF